MSPVVTPRAPVADLDVADASTAPDAPFDTPRGSSVRRSTSRALRPDRRFDTPRGSAFRHELPAWR